MGFALVSLELGASPFSSQVLCFPFFNVEKTGRAGNPRGEGWAGRGDEAAQGRTAPLLPALQIGSRVRVGEEKKRTAQ